jgi:prephenate dehydratase
MFIYNLFRTSNMNLHYIKSYEIYNIIQYIFYIEIYVSMCIYIQAFTNLKYNAFICIYKHNR